MAEQWSRGENCGLGQRGLNCSRSVALSAAAVPSQGCCGAEDEEDACGVAAAVVLTTAAPAMAQSKPTADLAVSYSVLYDKDLPNDIFGMNGWLPARCCSASRAPAPAQRE
jgi:hypothetical protein